MTLWWWYLWSCNSKVVPRQDMSRPPLPPTWPWGVFQPNERHCLRQIGSYITMVRGYISPPSLISGSTVGGFGQMVTIKELAGGALPLLRGGPTSSLHHPKRRFVPLSFFQWMGIYSNWPFLLTQDLSNIKIKEANSFYLNSVQPICRVYCYVD